MFNRSVQFLAVLSATSFSALAPSPAHACADIAGAALSIIASGEWVSTGATFFSAAQRSAFTYGDAELVSLWGYRSPGSPVYYDYIIAGHYFEQITNANGFAPGDVMVMDSTATYSGHTVIIRGVATEIVPPLNPIYAGTKQWAVPIADSTTSTHGCNPNYPDSRFSGSCGTGTFTPGPGTAYMRIYSNLAGGLLGHSWSVTSGGAYYSPATRPYAVGRMTPCPPLGTAASFGGQG